MFKDTGQIKTIQTEDQIKELNGRIDELKKEVEQLKEKSLEEFKPKEIITRIEKLESLVQDLFGLV